MVTIEAESIVYHSDEQKEGSKFEYGDWYDTRKHDPSGCFWRRRGRREEEEGKEVKAQTISLDLHMHRILQLFTIAGCIHTNVMDIAMHCRATRDAVMKLEP